ncbi:hypothetical protein ACTQ3V_15765, partial [Candidatus Agathobaculum pullicola]
RMTPVGVFFIYPNEDKLGFVNSANLSRSDLWTKCPEVRLLAVLPQPGYSFSDGHSVFKVLSIDELS